MSELLDDVAAGTSPTVSTASQWTDRYSGAVMDTFGPPQRVLVRGEGCYVWDADGKRYLDLLAGIAVNALGHAHPTLTAAVSAQLGTLGHVSNFFATPTQITLAETLLRLAEAPRGSRVFFTNSGTEALEAAFKMSRRVRPDGRVGRVLALEGAFHGRSMGALALTHKAAYREPFEPLPGGVEHLPFGDTAALDEAFSPEAAAARGPVAALVAERRLPDRRRHRLRRACCDAGRPRPARHHLRRQPGRRRCRPRDPRRHRTRRPPRPGDDDRRPASRGARGAGRRG